MFVGLALAVIWPPVCTRSHSIVWFVLGPSPSQAARKHVRKSWQVQIDVLAKRSVQSHQRLTLSRKLLRERAR
ncbi:hypothetical protein BD289DRAFT_423936 [Coniella lustricola]|uniref:Secreted protein n=1 Tax=Coniella lustricola TaxID=2025994 RepID=A0A2T3AJ32_9PEZI|nr:hypothetical protein BD289DRAFT_423936 [Coniella lustricola]